MQRFHLCCLTQSTVIMCPQLDNPGNASVTLSMDTLEMSTATYSCNFGFVQIAGNTSRTCQVDGSWSGVVPTCQSKLYIPCMKSEPCSQKSICAHSLIACEHTCMHVSLLYMKCIEPHIYHPPPEYGMVKWKVFFT